MAAKAEEKTVIVGTIGSDAHALGIWILTYALKKEGFKAHNIGVMVPQKEFIDAAIEAKADAIFVSSMYGHADLDCIGFRERCEEAGLTNMLIYIGGILGTIDQNWQAIEKRFKDMGFSRVYPPGTRPNEPIRDLREDLGIGQE